MSLKNLIALQNKKAGKNEQQPTTPSSVRDEGPAAESAPASVDSSGAEQLPSDGSPTPAPAPKINKGLGLNLLGAGRTVGSQRNTSPDKGVSAGRADSPVHKRDSGDDDGAVFGLADLAGFDATDESAPTRPTLSSGFDDEIEATAPERAITPDLSAQQMSFIESLDSIYPVLHDPDLFGQAVRIIMLELAENPEYKKLISDQDVHTMIRGMRNTMGMAKVRKQEKSRKTGGAGKAARSKKSAVSDDDMALLNNLLGDFGDD